MRSGSQVSYYLHMVAGFFNNIKNADKPDGLAEDIHDAMVDYQVFSQNSYAQHT